MEIEYQYAFTGRYGSSLYEALRERDFDNYIGKEKDYLLGEAKFGGEQREGFVLWLEDRLSYARWANRSEKAGVRCEGLSEYLMAHELPDDECELREKYADIRADDIMELEEGKADDIDTAYTFGFLEYKDLPKDVRRKMEFLAGRTCRYDRPEVVDRLRDFAQRLHDEAAEKLITVDGFHCEIHGGKTVFEKSIPISEVLKCPSCGHPVCRECANCHTDNPKNIEDAREYIASCESVSGHAYCGNCGDYSVEFMLRFLKAVNCPIPPECEEFKPIPRSARFCMTATVGALPNKDSILQTAIAEFNKGTAGIIEIQDPSGKIWAIPERHEDGWKVGIMRPEER